MKTSMIALLLMIMTASVALADADNANSPWKSQPTYGSQVASKAGFGAKNLLLGWTEIIQEPIQEKKVVGVVQGVGNAVMDTVGGFLHLLTAPFTTVDVPLPENGVSIWK